ncbi:MAG: PIG-L family deacetylase [Saprospiraceae bacterium]|nr:PIG-L family deacetylase [Saprospiraceae bacterium]
MRQIQITCVLIFITLSTLFAQKSKTSGEILEGIQKLKVLGSVLYIAAHPDDENTRLITCLSKDLKLNTAYLSLTRGDGGQNLIGSELDEYLGVIRTNELIEARKIDGGIQYFSRANDFGYSKNAEETFSFWNHDSVLLDVIRVIREFKPDIIINRFDHRTSGKTHGHHTASAILGFEAAKYSNSPLYKLDALKGTDMHIVQGVFFNTSWFFFGGKEKFDAMDKSGLYSLDVGAYYPAYGYSNNEIAAQSRSMHKSQGFGINSSRGSVYEYFERIDQAKDNSHKSPFDGLDLSWSRINGGGNVDKLIDTLILNYNYKEPWKNIAELQKIERYIEELSDSHWKWIKLAEVKNLILDCAGIFAESFTDKWITSPGSSILVSSECIVRSPVEARIESISIPSCSKDSLFNIAFAKNQSIFWTTKISIPQSIEKTSPFWLWNGRHRGMYEVDDLKNHHRPVLAKSLTTKFTIRILSRNYIIERDIIYKNDDPVLGEVKQNLDIIPAVTITQVDNLFIAKSNKANVQIQITANEDNQQGYISLAEAKLQSTNTAKAAYTLEKAGDKQILNFEISCNPTTETFIEIPILINQQKAYEYKNIKYPHIPWQNILIPASIKIINTDILINKKKRVAYIDGAGDYADEALIKMGYAITKIPASYLSQLSIQQYDVLLFGIRALNTQEELKNCKKHLDRFMNEGGKVIFQYNTTADLITDNFAPDSMSISRDRVTDETAEVRILKPEHPIFSTPNKITVADFNNWIQERGLYFPNKYSASYEEILSMNDPKEKALNSGILIKKVGKGWFVYSSLAWFRQLKAGVPGSYRLFSNLISF